MFLVRLFWGLSTPYPQIAGEKTHTEQESGRPRVSSFPSGTVKLLPKLSAFVPDRRPDLRRCSLCFINKTISIQPHRTTETHSTRTSGTFHFQPDFFRTPPTLHYTNCAINFKTTHLTERTQDRSTKKRAGRNSNKKGIKS